MGGINSSPKRERSRAHAQSAPSTQGNVSGAPVDAVPDVVPDVSHSQAVDQQSNESDAPRPVEGRCEGKSQECRNQGQSSRFSLKNNSTMNQDEDVHIALEKSKLEMSRSIPVLVATDTKGVNQSGEPGKSDVVMSGTANSSSHPQAQSLQSSQGSAASGKEGHVKLNNPPQEDVDHLDTKIYADGDPGQTSLSSQENYSTVLQDVQEPGPSRQQLFPCEVQNLNSSPRQERKEVNTDVKTEHEVPSDQNEGNFPDVPKLFKDGEVHDQVEKPTECEQVAGELCAPATPHTLVKEISPTLLAHSVDAGHLATGGTCPHAQQVLENAEVKEQPKQTAQSDQCAAMNTTSDASIQYENAKNSEPSAQVADSDAAVNNADTALAVHEDTNIDEQIGQPGPSVKAAAESDPPDTVPALGNVQDEAGFVNPGPTTHKEIALIEEALDDHAQDSDVQPNGLGSQGHGEEEQGVDTPEAEAQGQNAQADVDVNDGAPGNNEEDDDAQSEGSASDGSNASGASPEPTDAEVLYGLALRLYYGDDTLEADPMRATDLHMWAIEDFEHVPSMMAVADNSVDSDPNKAVTFYERAIDKGDTNAMRMLGDLLNSYIEGFDRNVKRSVELYTRAIDEGNDDWAMARLAELLLEGSNDELEADPEKAVELYTRLVDDHDDADSMLCLAKILETGIGPVPADPVRSVELCNRAINDSNDYNSMYYLAELLQRGAEGLEPDPERSLTLYAMLIEDSGERETLAILRLAKLLLTGCGPIAADPVRSAQLLQTAVDFKDVNAMHTFARLLEKGQGELEEDPKRAVELYEMAIDEEHFESMHGLANMLRRGCDEVPANHARAVELYEVAIEFGHCDSMFELGRMYEIGSEAINIDLPRAVELYEKAVNEGDHVKSMISLASLLQREQNGVRADPKRAFDLLISAVDKGQSTDAIVALALLLKER